MLNSIWNYVVSTATVSTLVGSAAVAVAVLLPKQLDFITDLRKWSIVVAVCAFGYSFTYTKGYVNGLSTKQAEWTRSLEKEAENGEKARSDAERAIGPVPSDRGLFRGDPDNRNRDGRKLPCD